MASRRRACPGELWEGVTVGLSDLVRSIIWREAEQAPEQDRAVFDWRPDSTGINFLMPPEQLRRTEAAKGGIEATAQLVLLRMLEGEDRAERIPGGFYVPTATASSLDEGFAEQLGLPSTYRGHLKAIVDSHTSSSGFRVRLVADEHGNPVPLLLKGPILTVGAVEYRATSQQVRALTALNEHAGLDATEKVEAANVALIAELQEAVRDGLDADLAHFTSGGWATSHVREVGVTGALDAAGNLVLSPSLGAGIDNRILEKRWAQLENARGRGVLRVEKRLLLLDETAVEAAREVLAHRLIRQEDVEDFLRTPSAFLDAQLIDFDLGFSVRVDGIGRVIHTDFGDETAATTDWFASNEPLTPFVLRSLIKTDEDLERFESAYRASCEQRADAVHFDGEIIDARDASAVEAAIAEVRKALATPLPSTALRAVDERVEPKVKVGFLFKDTSRTDEQLRRLAEESVKIGQFDATALARPPLHHQLAGIEWMLGLMRRAHAALAGDLYRLQGAILADDMGLGKTYMALVAIQQLNANIERDEGISHVKPTLVVAPLSLLENWEEEIHKTFAQSPFTDIVVLQAGRDLPRFRMGNTGRESMQALSGLDPEGRVPEERLRFSLYVGPDASMRRLDIPGRLVLTTYEALRNYQFSLSRIDWGVVVFDEAQTLKNPNAIRTRAAKALKSDFKLLTTGTPVENSLGDFWCLVDTAQPGLLGDWQAFRERYLVPLQKAGPEALEELRVSLGTQLRNAVGKFMLRRIKEDHIPGLPTKTVHTGLEVVPADGQMFDSRLARHMPDLQRVRYDTLLREFHSQRLARGKKADTLTMITRLRLACLHPSLDVKQSKPTLPATEREAHDQIAMSSKILETMEILHDVHSRNEKAIVFAMSKNLQFLLALWIQSEFGLRTDIVNGDTNAVSGRKSPSRRKILEQFESVPGFNVIIMSPLAAGVGLTIVAANHVIHLERHWNPAREAQATDRVYRIGQKREVHVYRPIAVHPTTPSFDVLLDRLLRKKVAIKDAVMTQPSVTEEELSQAMAAIFD